MGWVGPPAAATERVSGFEDSTTTTTTMAGRRVAGETDTEQQDGGQAGGMVSMGWSSEAETDRHKREEPS